MSYVIEILVFLLFFTLIANIIKKCLLFEALFILTSIIIVTVGEMLNLFVYKATAYTDSRGIPIYIILGGALIAWSYFKLPQLIAKHIRKNNLFMQIVLFLFLSTLFPVIEIAGIKAGLWYWLKPYCFSSIWWWIGVWKFYMIFLGIPVSIALLMFSLKQSLQKEI